MRAASPSFRLACGAAALLSLSACATLPAAHHTPRLSVAQAITLNGHPLTLHVAGTPGSRDPLLVYATGDGGWRGKDLGVYHRLVSYGYNIVGFSAPVYIKHLAGDDETTTPEQLAGDYAEVVRAARERLSLPDDAPVILVGVSRGAGLSVAAAGARVLRNALAGVVAIGLTKEEEHVRFRQLRRSGAEPPLEMLEVYEYLPRLGATPLAVIQATHDGYLPAEEARALFGPDTTRRRFHAIEARNHNFSDAREELYDAVHQSLTWIDGLQSSPTPAR